MRNFLTAFVIGLLLSAGLYSQQVLELGVAPGTILYFDLASGSCPTGWTEYTNGRGAYITGLVASGTKATLVGTTRLTDQENRTHTHTIAHTHSLSHTHTISSSGNTISTVIGGQPAETTSGATSVSDNHTHTFSVTSSDSSVANTGSETVANSSTNSTVIAPYIQYLLCQKS